MDIKILILFCMIFMHIVDDFYLQTNGWLANGKQKSWWEKNATDPMYRNDYKVALALHGFSWSFMVNIPLAIYMIMNYGTVRPMMIIIAIGHALIHAKIDHRKANTKQLNLLQDQLWHMVQILVIWIQVL